ncbi:hypothetical protein TRFO_28211 [Tritrichomonas foetus]|uniref:Uncharacterized protein n=1 Tax=Tritrichomonas foetus TaxID=1144522 RepID=A0A1J4JYT8_9EUKA|nr:hypothetical protein TRFO_28211 [Tritrichomonas foetus]|eukprot:OHT04321.1 hypothetical protein TRFO_28211 [Tritrichomonas foetus]
MRNTNLPNTEIKIPSLNISPLPLQPDIRPSNSNIDSLNLEQIHQPKNPRTLHPERRVTIKSSITEVAQPSQKNVLPKLDGANKVSPPSLIPHLNLANTARKSQSMNLNRFGNSFGGSSSVPGNSPSDLKKGNLMIPALNLQSLDLTNLPPQASKNETHYVYVCLLYSHSTFDREKDVNQFVANNFKGISVTPSEFDQNIVCEVNDNTESIPSLQTVDHSYQVLEHYPSLIEQTTSESNYLTQYIEDTLSEISEFRDKKEYLRIQNAIMKERIRVAKEEKLRFEANAKQLKKDFDAFMSKVTEK